MAQKYSQASQIMGKSCFKPFFLQNMLTDELELSYTDTLRNRT